MVLLTGGSRGIGRVLALELAKAGAFVAVLGKTLSAHPVLPGTLTETVNEVKKLGGEGLAIQCDVRHDDEVERAVQRCVEHFGSIDIVIHNAGALWWKSILETPASKFDLVMGVNARAAHLLAHHAGPYLRDGQGGHFLTMSPPVDVSLVGGKAAYMASKASMSMIALAVAYEWRAEGVAGNALWPETLVRSAATEVYKIGNPNHWYEPEIVSDAAMLLLQTDPTILTGQTLTVLEFLRSRGIEDFTRYRCVPDAEPPLLSGRSLPTVGGKTKSDGSGSVLV